MSITLDRTLDFLTTSLDEIEQEEIDARIREHLIRPTAPTVCNPDDFDAHVVAADATDQTPIWGSCSPTCSLL